HHRDLHPFPTRRSSDLVTTPVSGSICTIRSCSQILAHSWPSTYSSSLRLRSGRPLRVTSMVLTTVKLAGSSRRRRLLPSLRIRRSEEHTSELQSRENLV